MTTRTASVKQAFKWDVAPQAIKRVEPVGFTMGRHRFKIIIAVSLGLHILAFVIKPDLFFSSHLMNMEESWSVDVDMFTDLTDKAPQETALPKSEKSPEVAVPSNLLPQLPKKFEVVEQKPITEKTVAEEKDPKAEEVLADKKVQAPEREQVKKTEDDANKIELDDLKKRLAVEKLKEQNKVDERMKAQKDALAKLKDDIKTEDSNSSKGGAGSSVSGIQAANYAGVLSKIVHRNFNAAMNYKYQTVKNPPVFLVNINTRGELAKLKLSSSSGDDSYDSAALAALQGSAPFPKPPKALEGQDFEFRFSNRFN